MKKTKLYLNPLAAAIALMSGTFVAPQIAFAQDEAREVEEVLVVSARRRDETLQEVPIALSSFSGAELDQEGIQDIVQVAESVPNTTLKVSRGTNTTITAFIRGVGQQDPVAGFEAGVGIYMDDVYLNRPQGAVLDVYDVERIEILRGPQGTLYGRNTIGGAIKYVTKRLGDEAELSVKGALGTYNQRDLLISGSIPLANDTLKIGAGIASFNRDGFGENLFTGGEHYNKEVLAVRASLEYTPTDNIFIRLSADSTQDDSAPRAGYPLLTRPDIDIYDTNAGSEKTGHPIDENDVSASGGALLVEWSVSDDLTFKSITASREDRTESPIDFDSGPTQYFDVPVIYENEQFSQEFQLVFEGERVQGLVGAYYLDANAYNAFDVLFAGFADGFEAPQPADLSLPRIPNNGRTQYTTGDVDTKTWAIFTDFSVDLTDTVALSLGGRYTEDKRDVEIFSQRYSRNSNGELISPQFGGIGDNTALNAAVAVDGEQVYPQFNKGRTDTKFTPRISVSWTPDDSIHLYAGYSEGFKGGGFDPRGDYRREQTREGFKPETVDAFELGAKASFLDGRITTNLALFSSKYKNVQILGSILVDEDGDGEFDGFVGTTTNAGEGTIQGAELDSVLKFTDNFTAKFAIGLINADYDEFLESEEITEMVDATLVSDGSPVKTEVGTGEFQLVNNADDKVFQNTPDMTLSLGLTYSIPVGPGELTLSSSANYRSTVYQRENAPTNVNTAMQTQAGYTLFNANVVWSSDSDHWQAGLHALNLGDKEYITGGYQFGFDNNPAFYGNPRTITATVKYNL